MIITQIYSYISTHKIAWSRKSCAYHDVFIKKPGTTNLFVYLLRTLHYKKVT